MKFAKIVERGDDQYVIVKDLKDIDDDAPSLTVLYRPAGLGTCEYTLGFQDDPETSAESKRDAAFERMDAEWLARVMPPIFADFVHGKDEDDS